MKYLKKFNEELSPETLGRAAHKLSSMGHFKRSQKILDWSREKSLKETFCRKIY